MLVAPPVIAFGILVQYECFETIRSECVENGTNSQAQRLSVQPEFSQDAVFLLRFSFRNMTRIMVSNLFPTSEEDGTSSTCKLTEIVKSC
ncbi:hypothetical protein SAY87_018356 [Trapa incisa]|uniref:Uncharacterized protein n=1 Tax=Trapa incisa TaxID=236973 RepID=A0AAN7L5W4_9MYRT|nr:hypothetical protein SAY87_018356 [Trapa incisa]